MATLQDGSSADVVITYHDAHFALKNDSNPNDKGARTLGSGTHVKVSSTIANQNSSRYGLKVGIKVQIVKKNGDATEVPEGSFFFPMNDIDILRKGNRNFTTLHDADNNNDYSEQVIVESGPIADSQGTSIYVPDPTGKSDKTDNNNPLGYKCSVKDFALGGGKTGTIFTPAQSDNVNNNNGSFYSGFASVVDNQTAMNLTVLSAGGTNVNVSSFLMAGVNSDGNPIVHSIVSSRTGGGIIQTTQHGNLNGQLNDGSTKLGPNRPRTENTVVVPDGKTVVYTMTPTDGYRVKEITVDGTALDATSLSAGDEKTCRIRTQIDDAKLKNVDGRTYTFEFPRNNADHTIHVEYAADYHFKKEWVGEDATDLTVTATPYTYNKGTNRFVMAQSVNPVTFTVKADSVGVTSATENNKTTWSITYPTEGVMANGWNNTLPIEVPNTKSDDDLLYWFVTETVPEGYALQGYANENTTFDNFPAGSVRTAAGDTINSYADRAYMSFFDGEGGKITNKRRAEVQATKQWDDYDNGFGTRKPVTMHVSATVGGTTYNDILPTRTIAANASGDGLTTTWGTGVQYTGTVTTGTGAEATTTSHTVYASLAALQAANPTLTFTKDSNGITYTGKANAEDTGSTYYVNHLPAYDDDGVAITYTTTEDNVEGYAPGQKVAESVTGNVSL